MKKLLFCLIPVACVLAANAAEPAKVATTLDCTVIPVPVPAGEAKVLPNEVARFQNS